MGLRPKTRGPRLLHLERKIDQKTASYWDGPQNRTRLQMQLCQRQQQVATIPMQIHMQIQVPAHGVKETERTVFSDRSFITHIIDRDTKYSQFGDA